MARCAESGGFKADETRPNAWRYRDYVIASFNRDKPYDRFVQEQIAGDELWPDDPQARVATAFNRPYPDESNARNLPQRPQEILDDITDAPEAARGAKRGVAREADPLGREVRRRAGSDGGSPGTGEAKHRQRPFRQVPAGEPVGDPEAARTAESVRMDDVRQGEAVPGNAG